MRFLNVSARIRARANAILNQYSGGRCASRCANQAERDAALINQRVAPSRREEEDFSSIVEQYPAATTLRFCSASFTIESLVRRIKSKMHTFRFVLINIRTHISYRLFISFL